MRFLFLRFSNISFLFSFWRQTITTKIENEKLAKMKNLPEYVSRQHQRQRQNARRSPDLVREEKVPDGRVLLAHHHYEQAGLEDRKRELEVLLPARRNRDAAKRQVRRARLELVDRARHVRHALQLVRPAVDARNRVEQLDRKAVPRAERAGRSAEAKALKCACATSAPRSARQSKAANNAQGESKLENKTIREQGRRCLPVLELERKRMNRIDEYSQRTSRSCACKVLSAESRSQ